MRDFISRRWFLLALATVIVVGFLFSHKFAGLIESPHRDTFIGALVASVLFVMALPLEIGDLWRALRRPGPVLLAVAINFGLLPPFAWLVSQTLPKGMEDVAVGLVVMAAIPCTLASASVWTRRAGGNDSVAILVTLITNGTCFVVTPAWLKLLTGTETELPFGPLVLRLALLVVLPMAAAQLLRAYRPLACWATAKKTPLGVYAQCGILAMVLVGVTRAGCQLSQSSGKSLDIGSALLMCLVAVGIHVAMLWLGHFASRRFGINRADRIAVGFASSQKTLMVGLYVCFTYYSDMPLAILPMLAYHTGQLLIDTLVADRLRMTESSDGGPSRPVTSAQQDSDEAFD